MLCDGYGTPPRVLDASDSALRVGVRVGQPVREALTRCPTAEFLSTDAGRAVQLREDWLDALERVSPFVEGDGHDLGVALVSLEGLALLHGGELGVVEALAAATRRTVGVEPCVGVAEGPFAARVAALTAIAAAPMLVPPGGAPQYLASLPVDHLPLALAVRERLRSQFGLETIGDFASLPLSAVQAQFGPAGRTAWELAHGRDGRRLVARPRQERIAERLPFAEPIAAGEGLLAAARHLLTRLLQRPELGPRAARQVTMWLQVSEGPRWEKAVVLREATRDGDRLLRVVRRELERLWETGGSSASSSGGRVLSGPVAEMGLGLAGLCGESGQQPGLWREPGKRTPERRAQLAEAARQLKERCGAPALFHVVEVEPWSRIPERRRALIAYDP